MTKKLRVKKKIILNTVVRQHPDSQFVFIAMQNTHWYRADNAWTTRPEQAPFAEVEARGLHDCQVIGCEKEHAGSAEEWCFARIRASETQGGQASRSQGKEKRKTSRR
jgi:hypothetical protein